MSGDGKVEYEGEWKGGMRHGSGILRDSSAGLQCKGQWIDDAMEVERRPPLLARIPHPSQDPWETQPGGPGAVLDRGGRDGGGGLGEGSARTLMGLLELAPPPDPTRRVHFVPGHQGARRVPLQRWLGVPRGMEGWPATGEDQQPSSRSLPPPSCPGRTGPRAHRSVGAAPLMFLRGFVPGARAAGDGRWHDLHRGLVQQRAARYRDLHLREQ